MGRVLSFLSKLCHALMEDDDTIISYKGRYSTKLFIVEYSSFVLSKSANCLYFKCVGNITAIIILQNILEDLTDWICITIWWFPYSVWICGLQNHLSWIMCRRCCRIISLAMNLLEPRLTLLLLMWEISRKNTFSNVRPQYMSIV